ncbi:hypothetical protein BC937DRAFT_88387 [Endogone sp. FLAS-F59071]|nr:hypothetical protein BC937DRAFT_88387 [Endogone sp. FLAS-F59071]|eukprot:RUS18752.1 hypothetical protein BC937DRAFT_88387 [Endogone sp. FLAS-F59071]
MYETYVYVDYIFVILTVCAVNRSPAEVPAESFKPAECIRGGVIGTRVVLRCVAVRVFGRVDFVRVESGIDLYYLQNEIKGKLKFPRVAIIWTTPSEGLCDRTMAGRVVSWVKGYDPTIRTCVVETQ